MFNFFRRNTVERYPADMPYTVFTKKHDLEILAEDIVAKEGTSEVQEWHQRIAEYEKLSTNWKISIESEVSRLTSAMDKVDTSNIVASILIDHSGSLKGIKSQYACAVAEIIADCWSRSGIKYEILGFTTTLWRGGKSRKRWLVGRRKPNPGRLCDLLHIIYRTFDAEEHGAPSTIRNLLRDSLLKENVDGEALQWAADRLNDRPELNKIILVISDGAPVDDSTLSENHSFFLFNHLKSIIAELEASEHYTLGAIGIGYEVSGFYSQSMSIETSEDIGKKIPEFAQDLISFPPDLSDFRNLKGRDKQHDGSA